MRDDATISLTCLQGELAPLKIMPLAAQGTIKGQAYRPQCKSGSIFIAGAVFGVPHNRKAAHGEMAADLMKTSGFEGNQQSGSALRQAFGRQGLNRALVRHQQGLN